MSTQENMERLDRGIRLLKVQYDQYFSGALKLPPFELRSEVEQLIRRYSHKTFEQATDRFYFNSLVCRFNSFSELWAKCLRLKEEGRAVPGYPAVAMRPGQAHSTRLRNQAALPPARPDNGNGNATGSNPELQADVGGPGWDPELLRPLYEQYMNALKTHGKASSDVSFAMFSQQVERKAEAVKNRASCDAVRLRLTFDEGRVLFKARPLRRKRKTS